MHPSAKKKAGSSFPQSPFPTDPRLVPVPPAVVKWVGRAVDQVWVFPLALAVHRGDRDWEPAAEEAAR